MKKIIMKIYNTIITILILTLSFTAARQAYAQQPQKIDPTVEVERDFESKMPNIHKSRLNTAVNDTLGNFNLNFNYSIFDKPYKDLYEFSPLPSVQIQNNLETKYPVFMAKASIGVPANPIADIWFQPYFKGGSTLQFNASYNGFYDKIELIGITPQKKITKLGRKAAANNHTFDIGGTYGYNWSSGELSLSLNYSSNYNTYYGFTINSPIMPIKSASEGESIYSNIEDNIYMKDNFSHRYNQVGAKFSIGSINAAGRGAKINYNLNLSYLNTSDNLPPNGIISSGTEYTRLNESYIKASGEIGPSLGRYSKFTIGVNSQTVIYKNIQDYNYGILDITPQYTMESKRFILKAGIKISSRYTNRENTDKNHQKLFVNASISYEIAKNNFWIYANLNGGNYINAYSSLLDDNKWISQYADLKAGSMPHILKGGFRGQIRNRFSYHLYLKHANHKGLLQYIPSNNTLAANTSTTLPDSRLYTAYSNHKEFAVGGEIEWHSKDFTAASRIEYSSYTDGEKSTIEDGHKPFGYAPLKWYTHATYNYRDRIYIGISANIRGAAPLYSPNIYITDNATAEDNEAEISSFCNLGANFKYVVNRNFSIFVIGENLLNDQIEYYPNYLEKGISFSVGILVKL